MRSLGMDEMKGRDVMDERGARLGRVEEVLFDPDAWRVTGIRVGLDREAADRLRLTKPFFHGPELTFGAERVRTVGDAVILNVDERAIADLLMREP